MILGSITATEWTAFGGVLFVIICALVGALYKAYIREMRDIKNILTEQIALNAKVSVFMEHYQEDRNASKADREAYQRSIGVQSGRIDSMLDQLQSFKNDITLRADKMETVVDRTVDDLIESRDSFQDSKDNYDKATDALGKVKKHYEKQIKEGL